jgi:hypothetical protein
VRAAFCPGTGRRGACGSPSAEPPPRLREAGGITPGRFGPFMPLGAPAGAVATGVAGISGASGTAAAAKGSSKMEARAMAPEPQPRSRRPCRPGAETGEQSARARSRSPDFRRETRVAVRRPAAGDGAIGRGGLEQGKKHVIYTRCSHGDGCYRPGAGPRPRSPPFGGGIRGINRFMPRLPRTRQRPWPQASAHGGGPTRAGCRTAQRLAILRLRCPLTPASTSR